MSFGAEPKFDSVPGTYFGELPIVCCRTGTSRPLKGPGYPCAVIDGRGNAALIQHGEERMPLIWRPISEIPPSPPVKIANSRQLPLSVLNFELMPRQQLEPGEPEAKPNDERMMCAFGKYKEGNKPGAIKMAIKMAQSMLGPKSRKDWHSWRTNSDGSWAFPADLAKTISGDLRWIGDEFEVPVCDALNFPGLAYLVGSCLKPRIGSRPGWKACRVTLNRGWVTVPQSWLLDNFAAILFLSWSQVPWIAKLDEKRVVTVPASEWDAISAVFAANHLVPTIKQTTPETLVVELTKKSRLAKLIADFRGMTTTKKEKEAAMAPPCVRGLAKKKHLKDGLRRLWAALVANGVKMPMTDFEPITQKEIDGWIKTYAMKGGAIRVKHCSTISQTFCNTCPHDGNSLACIKSETGEEVAVFGAPKDPVTVGKRITRIREDQAAAIAYDSDTI